MLPRTLRFSCDRPIGVGMDFDFAEVLLEVMRRNASDLHMTAGSPPMVRERG